jgi:hypothetical protein
MLACLCAAAPASAQTEQLCGPAPAALCIGLDKLTERAGAECRRAEALCPSDEPLMAAYEASATHRILGFQYDLGRDVGFANAQWIGTHNSFNSPSEETTVSSTDSNQQRSLTDQLRMDVRSLELDLHWIRNTTVVCHGRPESELNAGCTTERELPAVLAEITAWLDANPDQVLMLYLEDDMSSDAGRADAAGKLNAGLGERLYKPEGGCTQLPGELTRNDVLASGAQVFLVSGCDDGAGWNDTVFDWNTMHDESGGSTGYECNHTPNYDDKLIRYFEDTTWLSAMISPGGPPPSERGITPEVAGKMIRCGVDLLGMDQLQPNDGRLEALVWSWALDASPAAGDCAMQRGSDGRWIPGDCSDLRPAACHDAVQGTWEVTAPVAFADAAAACTERGAAFAVPRTGWENEQLRVAAGGSDVTLGLSGQPLP